MPEQSPIDVYQLLNLLNQKNIRVWQEDSRLCYSAEEGAMTAALKDLLRQNKQALLDFLQNTQAISPLKHIENKDDVLDLSFAQQRIWYASQLTDNDNSFLISSAFLLEGTLNLAALEQASEYLGTFYSAINQRFFASESGPKQQAVISKHPIKAIYGFNNIEPCLEDAPKHYAFNLNEGKLSQTLLYPLTSTRYVIIFALHHIVADAHSMALLAKQLIHCYQCFSDDKKPQLKNPPLDYGDYILWQQKQQQSGKWQQQLHFWQQQLQTQSSLCLPIIQIKQNPASQSLNVSLSGQQTKQLQQLASEQKATLFMVLQTVLAASLSLFSHGENIAIGNPVSGRQEPGLEDIFGCFINLVVCQQRICPKTPTAKLLEQAKQTTLATFANQDVPFEQVVKALNPERDGLHSPLFQVLFNFQEQSHYQQQAGAVSITPLSVKPSASPYPLSLEANLLENNCIQLQWLYRDDLLPEGFVHQLNHHFGLLCDFFTQKPNANLNDFKHQQVFSNSWFIQGKTQPIGQKTFADYLQQAATRKPEAVAVIDGERRLSYQTLHQHSNALANSWQAQNFKRVAIFLPEGYLAICAMVAAAKAGIAFVPFSYQSTKAYINQCLQQVPVDAFISEQTLHIETLDKNEQLSFQNHQSNPSFAILFTSGSSGQPKAVHLKQQAIINRLVWMQDCFALQKDERVLQKTDYSFDVSLSEIFWPLMFGGTLVSATAKQRFDSQAIATLINQHRVSFCHFVPSMLQQFLQHQTGSLPSLKNVVVSGEVLTASLQQQFFSQFNNCQLYNLYGPTEAAIDVSYHLCKPNLAPCIGKPIHNCQIAITHGQQLLPPFAMGEITLAGACLAEGYVNSESQAFDKQQTLGRCYYTGDMGFIDNKQQLHFIGRNDRQLKVRGVRIQPEQIEHALQQHPAVSQSLLVVAQQRLLLFYQGQAKPEQELQLFLQNLLPHLMLPQRICHIEAWPRLASGKIDNKALIRQLKTENSSKNRPARNKTEEKLLEQWQALLNVDNIGVYDNFFELGGHSLLASQAVYQCQQTFGVSIQLSDIITNPCIATVAKAVEQALYWQTITSAVDDDEGEDIVV